MLDFLKKLITPKPIVDLKKLFSEGAQIIDVRSEQEYRGGHISGSINIPLPSISQNLSKIKKDKPIITCCASGMRSASARSTLMAHGFTNVINGGGWMSLQQKLR